MGGGLPGGGASRRAAIVAYVVITALVATAVACPGTVSAAAGLITGADIKDGSVQKVDLAPKVRAQLGVRGPYGPNGVPGAAGPRGPSGPAGASGPTGSPGASGAAGQPAEQDGPAMIIGRIADPAAPAACLVAAPAGFSASAACSVSAAGDVEMPLPSTYVLRNLRFQLDAAAAIGIRGELDVGGGVENACQIDAGATSCTAVGDVTLSAGTHIHIEAGGSFPDTIAVGVGFSYELWSPAAAAAAAAPPVEEGTLTGAASLARGGAG
jgi:hypothetical protein